MFKRFVSYYKPHKVLFFFDMFASLLIALIGMLYPMLTRKVFSDYVKENNIKMIIIAAIILFILYLN